MTLTLRKKMKIACSIAGKSINQVAREWGVSDMTIHHFLNGRKINGKKTDRVTKQIDSFISEQFKKCNLTAGNIKNAAA